MRFIRLAMATALIGCSAAAQATTVVIYVEPMTLQRYTKVFDTPGRDRVLMCMVPPSTGGCTEVPVKRVSQATDSSKPSNSLRPSMLPWAGSTTLSG
jgi:hypothetical protein